MSEREILKLLKQDGWIITEGGRHHIATHQTKPGRIAIPRHKGDIPIGTVKEILRVMGLK